MKDKEFWMEKAKLEDGQDATTGLPQADTPIKATQYYKFEIGDRVTKVKGSRWTGRVVGYYSTELTPNGYCIESETETGSVQIYPEAAIISATPQTDKAAQREDVSGENLDIPKELQMTTAERDALRKATTPAPIDADVSQWDEPHNFEIDGCQLTMTCDGSPEQYDVFFKGEQIAYFRIRWGMFWVHEKCAGGDIIYEKEIAPKDTEYHGKKLSFAGNFQSAADRKKYLTEGIRAALKKGG